MNTNIDSLYEYLLKQMAAESYFEGSLNEQAIMEALNRGANRIGYRSGLSDFNDGYPGYTRMTAVQISDFISKSNVVHQWSDDPTPNGSRPAPEGFPSAPRLNNEILANTGLSATLMQDKRTGSFTLSIRSTEFRSWADGGDGERDKTGADITSILFTGFALAQLDALEHYYQWLKDNGQLPLGANLDVTGYSLGGHLATVFTEIHQNDADVFLGQTVTFNGAGRGRWDSSVGSEAAMLSYYRAVLNDPGLAPDPGGADAAERRNAIALVGQPFDPKYIYGDGPCIGLVDTPTKRSE